jgi:hypothetical protein
MLSMRFACRLQNDTMAAVPVPFWNCFAKRDEWLFSDE